MSAFDFTVSGIPISAQAKSPKARASWKRSVATAALVQGEDAQPAATDEVSATIIYFYEGDADIDVDNIAKPILDALSGIAYIDDSQVTQVTIRKTPLTAGLLVNSPPPTLAAALEIEADFVYIRVAGPPNHRRLP